MKKLPLAIVTILAIGLLFFVVQKSFFVEKEQVKVGVTPQNVEEIIITLTDEGFIPNEVTIQKGDTVRWVTDSGKLFWPASNLHPSHRDYPGGVFDPKEPIQPNDSWSFTFDMEGDWKFHDHLAPYYTGIIHVKK